MTVRFVHPQAWRRQAVCAGTDPELFHSAEPQEMRLAVSLCRQCPVTVECLQEAIRHEDGWGVWGGLTASQRRKLLARRPARASA